MFFHNFKYAFLTLFKNKMLIFWTFAFPIVLGTFFYMAFSDIENSEKLKVIDIAIVNNTYLETHDMYKEAFESLSDEANEQQLFNTRYVSEEEAIKLLEDDEVSGYLILEDSPKIIVKESGINETILKYVTEEIMQMEDVLANVIEQELQSFHTDHTENEDLNTFYANIYTKVLTMQELQNTNIKNVASNHLSYTMIEYYTLIAMTCLYGGILGMTAMNQNLANMSHNGKRVAVSPTKKWKVIISSVLASFLTQIIGIVLLFIYTIFVLKVDYGNHFGCILLLTFVGCLSGLSLGIAIASLFKTNENTKVGIIIAVTMFWCFLSGMMGITMKYIVDKNIPLLNKINPASMITDGFYSLYYYDTMNRFYFNVISLVIFSGVMIALSMYSLRRQKYDSI